VKRLSKRFLKILAIVVGSILVLLTAFHFWFVNHAEELLQNLVSSKSNGTLKLKVGNFKFNWLSKKMELEDAVFYTTDSTNANTTYRFAVRQIKLKVTAVLPMIFEKRVLINLLSLQDPDVVITKIRASDKTSDSLSKKDNEDVSIPREMGRIYNSIQDALNVLKVKKFEIENATVTLENRSKPDALPVVIKRIDFHIDNLKVDTGTLTGKEKIFFSDNVVFKSRDQDIRFPNGRHRLSYRKFRINIEHKIVEFDSCTIASLKTDSTAAAFSIYFDALTLTNIDFDTLYRAEVIKADSVYCVNPRFTLDIDLDKRKKGRKPPKLDEIIQQLTGDMLLNFVVVKNASFNINTVRNGNPSSFTSEQNNFEIQGLSIDKEAPKPLRVKKFALAIRNYQNFLRDSAYEMRFDSILFNDDRIFLSNFTFRDHRYSKAVKSFMVPRFQLTGLSWDDLLFEQKLTAQQATLYNPEIYYTESPKKNRPNRKRSLFEVIATINDVMMLEDLNIIDGNINLYLNGGIEMKLRDATVSIESRSLLGSQQLSAIRRSVNYLDFSKGYFKINDFTVLLEGINYTGPNSRLKAVSARVHNSSNKVSANARNVTMDEIFINEDNGDVTITGVGWQNADVKLAGLGSKSGNTKGSVLHLKKISGNNTRLSGAFRTKQLSMEIDNLAADEFLLHPGQKPVIKGLAVKGNKLQLTDPDFSLDLSSFNIKDKQEASFEGLNYKSYVRGDSTNISVHSLSFKPDVHSVIHDNIIADNVTITKPVVTIHTSSEDSVEAKKSFSLPFIKMDKLLILQPELDFTRETINGTLSMKWNGSTSANNSILLMDAHTRQSSFYSKQLHLSLNNFLFSTPDGNRFDAGEGEITAQLNDISFSKEPDSIANWKATITNLEGKNFIIDSLGKKSGRLNINKVELRDLLLHSETKALRGILEENKRFRLQQITGSYTDAVNMFNWYNAVYDKSSKMFSLDSFSYRPAADRDSFIAIHPYQTDYIHFKTGKINIGPFDIDRYLKDTILSVGILKADDIVFTDFRDKRKPLQTGLIKPLITNRIKSIPIKLSIDTILFNNANATYEEFNPKTGQSGIIPVTRMTIRAFPVRNFDLSETDSLRLQANIHVMDSIWIRLRMRESYLDSLGGFLFTVRMKPADMRVLNPVLAPLASVKLKSGFLDTLSMRVGGAEYFAYGEMKMRYHDFKVQVLRNGSPNQKRLFNGLLNFIANTVIKNKNEDRTGQVFFVRDRERSALNYLIKITFSGVNTSIGLRGNRKVMRSYKKELRKRNLPPVDYD
jgi:hypothetical protein